MSRLSIKDWYKRYQSKSQIRRINKLLSKMAEFEKEYTQMISDNNYVNNDSNYTSTSDYYDNHVKTQPSSEPEQLVLPFEEDFTPLCQSRHGLREDGITVAEMFSTPDYVYRYLEGPRHALQNLREPRRASPLAPGGDTAPDSATETTPSAFVHG